MTQTTERLGGLYGQIPDQPAIVFPLKQTQVRAKIAGNVSRVQVTQSFENPLTIPLEAVYIFPLPDEAAVNEMEIRIGERIIRGSIEKRQEAQQIYEQAKQRGQTAGLLEQERDNIFTQFLANIQPGEQIDVVIHYTDCLKFEGGSYEFVFPMVVGPRYIPGTPLDAAISSGSAALPMSQNQDTDLVPDASRLNAPILPAGMRSGYDICVTVEIDAGVEIQSVQSPSHQLQIVRGQTVQVKLAGGDTIPNKDLMVRYQVAGEQTQATVLTQVDERGGHFALYVLPALHYEPQQVLPKDLVFLIDTSGSQAGAPLIQCQTLMCRFINGLNPEDSFSIIDFSNSTRQLSPTPLANTTYNRSQALRYINQLSANGGTNLMQGIQTVLNFPVVDPGRLRSIVLLTDGYIGNENQILAEVQRLQSGNRLYSFGAGSSVNRFLLNRIAELGRGMARIIRADEPVESVVEQFFRQINQPVLTHLQLRWEGGGEAPIFYPSPLPDLFSEQPLVLFGRKSDGLAGKLSVTGIVAGGGLYQQTFDLNFDQSFDQNSNAGIAQLWGRARIKSLMNQMMSGETKTTVDAVTETALTYQLLSQYTAFVAVSNEARVDSMAGLVSVQVPVELPDAISQAGIFGSAVGGVDRNMLPGHADLQLVNPLNSRSPTAGAVSFSQPLPSPSAPAAPSARTEARQKREGRFVPSQGNQPPQPDRLQVLSLTEATAEVISHLQQHLRTVSLPVGISGRVVFELHVQRGRIRRVVLNDQSTTLTDQAVTEAIRRLLLTWRPLRPLGLPNPLILELQVN